MYHFQLFYSKRVIQGTLSNIPTETKIFSIYFPHGSQQEHLIKRQCQGPAQILSKTFCCNAGKYHSTLRMHQSLHPSSSSSHILLPQVLAGPAALGAWSSQLRAFPHVFPLPSVCFAQRWLFCILQLDVSSSYLPSIECPIDSLHKTFLM